jgi:uncharacterized protein YcfJ
MEPLMFSKATMVAIAVGLAIGAPALANENAAWPDDSPGMSAASDYDYARVTQVEPRLREVRVSVPRRECYEDAGEDLAYRQVGERPAAGGMIIGGLIGAVIGHQIGYGHERALGTVAGAVIGSAIGRDAATQRRDGGSYGYSPRGQGGERCETRYTEQVEQRIDGYRVSYSYRDRNYQTVLPYDPGERLRVRVTVRPEGY